MHYYNFNIGDYISHTRHLSVVEDCAYRRLLDLYYLHEQPLNECSTTVARMINMREHEQEVLCVLEEFFIKVSGVGWTNFRADEEIKKYKTKVESASRAGKLSAERRLNQRSTPVQLNKKQETRNNIKEKINKKKEGFVPDDVDEQVWKDFVQQRNAIKAPVTQTALTRIRNEATKVGWDLNQALAEVTARGWRGFKSEWVLRDREQNPNQNQKLGAARAIFGDERKSHDRNIIDITPTTTHALGTEDLSNDAGPLRDSVPEHVEDRSDFI
jgi:uncharacterized protein YdaU (DUF1376 family)